MCSAERRTVIEFVTWKERHCVAMALGNGDRDANRVLFCAGMYVEIALSYW